MQSVSNTKKFSDVVFITKHIGSAITVDVIKFDPVSMEVIVRVKERYVISVVVYWNLFRWSLTIYNAFSSSHWDY